LDGVLAGGVWRFPSPIRRIDAAACEPLALDEGLSSFEAAPSAVGERVLRFSYRLGAASDPGQSR
jgi:hypothetical protein